ncbi:MAG: tRNA lysidine(34) synthetase TilS, partial [Coprococcus sp.]
VLRQRRPGDFMMIGGGHKKAIRRILMDDKVPQSNRETLNMLTDGGHVLWIPDTGRMSEYYKITGETRLILSAELKEIEE